MCAPLDTLFQPLSDGEVHQHEAELRTLQGNILKGHGRPFARHIFLRFKSECKAEVKRFLADAIPKNCNAYDQIISKRPKELSDPANQFVSVSLSAAGYQYLGFHLSEGFDPSFLAGMRSQATILRDPDLTEWNIDLDRRFPSPEFPKFPGKIHALVLLADADLGRLDNRQQTLLSGIEGCVEWSIVEAGKALFSKSSPKVAIEHFGYADGASQPILLAEEEAPASSDRRERDVFKGGTIDRRHGPRIVVVRDPLREDSFGSYLVFRKLEQKVAAFWRLRGQLAVDLQIDEDHAGALAIGRHEDGKPLVDHLVNPGIETHRINAFNYDADPNGLRCPMFAHIRKVNPRGSSRFGADSEVGHRIVRRGIPYGDPLDPQDIETANDTGRGLLFMCYQLSISAGFEVLQTQWIGDGSFPAHESGIDPIAGKNEGGSLTWTANGRSITRSFEEFILLKGGEYFFTPSIPFLRGLPDRL